MIGKSDESQQTFEAGGEVEDRVDLDLVLRGARDRIPRELGNVELGLRGDVLDRRASSSTANPR